MMRGFFLAAFTALMLSAAVAKAETIYFKTGDTSAATSMGVLDITGKTSISIDLVNIQPHKTPVPIEVGSYTLTGTSGSATALAQSISMYDGSNNAQIDVSKTINWTLAEGKLSAGRVVFDYNGTTIQVEVTPDNSTPITTNGGTLTAKVTDSVAIPLPATAWMGLALLGGLGVNNIRRRMKSA